MACKQHTPADARGAEALHRLVSIALKVVIKRELLSKCNVLQGEQPNGKFPLDKPLLGLAVWLTRVIDEAGDVALHRSEVRRESAVPQSKNLDACKTGGWVKYCRSCGSCPSQCDCVAMPLRSVQAKVRIGVGTTSPSVTWP